MKRLLALSILFILSSCGMPDIRIKRKVDFSEVVGTWVLDPKSTAIAEDYDGDNFVPHPTKPHTITFNSDGTCHYRSVLQMPTRYVDTTGKWSITTDTKNPKVSKIQIELSEPTGKEYSFSLDFREESGHLIIWEFWNDPDLWNFLDYKRQQTEQD